MRRSAYPKGSRAQVDRASTKPANKQSTRFCAARPNVMHVGLLAYCFEIMKTCFQRRLTESTPSSALLLTSEKCVPALAQQFADVALIDGREAAAVASTSYSQFLELVRNGLAPPPCIKEPRFTRWRSADIRSWLQECCSAGRMLTAVRNQVAHQQCERSNCKK